MTRFARKTAPRGTTKREPEAATPWSQLVATIKDNREQGVEEEGSSEEDDGKPDVGSVEEEDEEESEDDYSAKLTADSASPLKRKAELISADEPVKKKKKKPAEKCKVCRSKEHRQMDCGMLSEERRKELQDLYAMKIERKGKGTGRKKKKRKDKLPYEDIQPADKTTESTDSTDETEDKKDKKADKSAEKKTDKPKKKQNRNKFKKGKEQRDRSGALVEAGEAIFHGFRVKQEDERRLRALYEELKTKGLSKAEVESAIKRERRVAEKALQRSKKLVCFKCRQPGHMLADCPAANEGDTTRPTSGLCFKCGSLEHTSKDCKSKQKRENAYNFATCFICKQDGHLAKACPDNPKGLYPKGGGCCFCGSVEHLKRDCVRKVEKDLRAGVRVGTIGGDLEDEPSNDTKILKRDKKKKKAEKVVAF